MPPLLLALALSTALIPTAPQGFEIVSPAADQEVERTPVAIPLAIDAPVKAVTVYRGRAAVTRRGAVQLDPGIFELRFSNLPERVDAGSLQARATGVGRILSVEYVQRTVAYAEDPAVAALDRTIEAVKKRIGELADEQAVLAQQSKLVDGVAIRVANDASDAAGTTQLDLEALRRQMVFVGEQRTALADRIRTNDDARQAAERELAVLEADRRARASGETLVREAVVTVAASEGGATGVELTYLVANAGWEPTYSVRAAPPASTVAVEYDALLQQRSGEDWNDVEMVLSTAEPMRAANPPSVSPWF
ncbi:MAG: mucoidy inhibitor MuiA family protein, partial [Phycisphaerales bacterium]|nr:mucoidy inhibitor MuiA family protein [Phycisphaerales bacterium]